MNEEKKNQANKHYFHNPSELYALYSMLIQFYPIVKFYFGFVMIVTMIDNRYLKHVG